MIKILYHLLIISLLVFIAYSLYIFLYEEKEKLNTIDEHIVQISKQLECDLDIDCGLTE